MKELREYQDTAIEGLREGIRLMHQRQVLQLPTGAGKTLIAAAMTRSAMEKKKTTMFLCDRIELISQTSMRFDEEGIPHGVIQGTHPRYDPQQLVQVATVQTIVRREFTEPDLVFVDECHGGGKRLNDFIKSLTRSRIIGLSATPFTRGMGLVYSRLVKGPSVTELIKLGNLVQPIVYAPTEPDLSQVKIVAGEYDEKQLEAVMDKPKLIGDIVATWLQRANRRQTIVFACGVAHSKHLVEQFQAAGVNAEHLDGYTSQYEREMIIARFRRGATELISNVGILDRGFDVPNAGCCIYARPIKASLSLYIQMGGRVLRAHPGKKDALILDHAGNTLRHGFLDDPLPDELDMGKPLKDTPPRYVAPMPKPCPKCRFVKPRGVHACPQCGFAPAMPNAVFAEAGELELMVKIGAGRQLYSEIKYIGLEKNYSPGWAKHTFKKITGNWPTRPVMGGPPIPPSQYTKTRVQQLIRDFRNARKAVRV